MAVRYQPEKKNKYIIGSILQCGECGSGYRRKCNNGTYYWTCANHDKNADNCLARLIPEDIIRRPRTKENVQNILLQMHMMR